MMNRKELQQQTKFSTIGNRVKNNEEIDAIISQWVCKRRIKEIAELCDKFDVSYSPVNEASELADWNQIARREVLTPLKHSHFRTNKGPLAPNFPVKFSCSDVSLENPAPKPTEHFSEVMRDWLGDADNQNSKNKQKK